MSNTRRSVSSDVQTLRSSISNTRRCVLSDIQTPRSNIPYRTREGMFHLIFKQLEVSSPVLVIDLFTDTAAILN